MSTFAPDSGCIADARMLEIGSDTSGRFLDSSEMAQRLAMKSRLVAGRDVGIDGALQIPVEVFVGIEIGRIGRQEEDLNRGGPRRKPLAHLRRLVHAEVIENQEDLLRSVADQAPHEIDQGARLQGALEDHEADLALICDGRQDRETLAACRNINHRRLTLRGVTTMPRLVTAQAGLVGPADLGLLAFGTPGNSRVLHFEPPLHRCVIALVGSLLWPLRRKPPTREIKRRCALRQPDPKLLPNQLLHGAQCPEGERQAQLVRTFAADPALDLSLLLHRKLPARSASAATAIQGDRRARRLLELSCQSRAVAPRISRNPTDLYQRLAFTSKGENLLPQLDSRLHGCRAPIACAHRKSISPQVQNVKSNDGRSITPFG